MNLEWSLAAERDLQHIEDVIAADRPRAAARMLLKIEEAVEELLSSPYLGRPGRIEGTRERVIPNSPYVAVYMLSDKLLFMMRVIHGAQ